MTDKVIEIFVNWFPMLLLIAVWVYFLRRMGGGRYMTQYQRDCMDQMRRNSEAMERIAAALEKQMAN